MIDKIKNRLNIEVKSLITFIAFVIMFTVTYFVTKDMQKNNTELGDWVYIAIQGTTYVLFIVILFNTILRKTYDRITWTLKNEFKNVLKVGLFGMAAYLVLNFGISLIAKPVLEALFDLKVGESANQDAINTVFTSSGSSALLMAAITIIVGPITEEIAFRKGLIGSTSQTNCHIFRKAGIVLSVFLFGAMHVFITGDWQNITPYLIMGAVLAYIYVKHNDNVTYSIAVHVFVNTFSIILMLFTL